MYTWKHHKLPTGMKVIWKDKFRGKFFLKEGVLLAYIPSDEKISDILPVLKNLRYTSGQKITQISLVDRYAVKLTKVNDMATEGYAFPPCAKIEDFLKKGEKDGVKS